MNKKIIFLFLILLIAIVPVFAYDFFSEINHGFDVVKASFYNKNLESNKNANLVTGEVVQQNCLDENTLFKVSSSTNAHAAVYTDQNYNFKACLPVNIKITDRTCNPDGSNVIIKLSANFNAHVEKPTQNNYNVNVCSSDIACSYKSISCGAGEECIASISGDTNAHISDCSPGYDTKLCCKASQCSSSNLPACTNLDSCANAGGVFYPPNDPKCCPQGKRWDSTRGLCVEATGFSTCTKYPPEPGSYDPANPPHQQTCCQASLAYGFWTPAGVFP